jgi:hypothetical protein
MRGNPSWINELNDECQHHDVHGSPYCRSPFNLEGTRPLGTDAGNLAITELSVTLIANDKGNPAGQARGPRSCTSPTTVGRSQADWRGGLRASDRRRTEHHIPGAASTPSMPSVNVGGYQVGFFSGVCARHGSGKHGQPIDRDRIMLRQSLSPSGRAEDAIPRPAQRVRRSGIRRDRLCLPHSHR